MARSWICKDLLGNSEVGIGGHGYVVDVTWAMNVMEWVINGNM